MTSFFLSSSPFPNIKAHIIGLNSTPIIGTLSIDNSLIYTKKPHISVRLPGAENETRARGARADAASYVTPPKPSLGEGLWGREFESRYIKTKVTKLLW